MVDEDKLLTDSTRAMRAQQLLQDTMLQEAYATIEANLVAAWIGSDARDDDGRKRCWDAVQANRNHKDFLDRVVSGGKLAQAELKMLAEAAERKKRRA